MRIEFKCSDGSTIVNLGGTDASFSHFLLLICILSNYFAGAPQSYCAVLHTARNDALVIELINPIKRGESGRTERVAYECYKDFIS